MTVVPSSQLTTGIAFEDFSEAIERAYESSDFDRVTALIENNPLIAWFAVHPGRLAVMITEVLRHSDAVGPLLPFISSTLRAETPEGIDLPAPRGEVEARQVRSLRVLGEMFKLRLVGRTIEALERSNELDEIYTSMDVLFDRYDGWGLFAAVQHAVTAMLAGDFDTALLCFTRARMHVFVPNLSFLTRDACAKAALLEALYGDSKAATLLIEQAEQIARSSSWVEDEIDATLILTRGLLDTYEQPSLETLRQLELLAPATFGESWPFYLAVMHHVLLATGNGAAAVHRMELFAQMPLPRVEGDGFTGSVLQLSNSLSAMAQGDLEEARAQLGRADQSITVTRVLRAMIEVRSGLPREALSQAAQLREGTQRLRRLELSRLATVAGGHFLLGELDECEAALARAQSMGRPLTAEETVVFAAELHALALDRLADWPRRDNGPTLFELAGEVLTERELESLRLLARGLSREQIARELFITVNTLKGYLRSMYRKLGVKGRAAAVIEAERRGLL